MPQALIIAFVIAFIGIFILAAILSAKAARERRAALGQLASARGWSFDPEPDSGHCGEFPQFGVFQQGHSREAYNTIRGQLTIAGRVFPLKCGDYKYEVTTSNGKTTTTTTHRLSYVILTLPFAVPDLHIRRENLLDKVAAVMGFDDINFESEEFSRRFCVKSSDKKFAYDVISPKMMEWLLAQDPFPVDLRGGRVCFTSGSSTWGVGEFGPAISWAEDFFTLWPAFLLEDLASGSVGPGIPKKI